MADQRDFAERVQRINAKAATRDKKLGGLLRSRRNRSAPKQRGGMIFVMPLMTLSIIAGGLVFAWEVMERPTDNPFEMAAFLAGDLKASDLVR